MTSDLADRLASVDERISQALRSSGRGADQVTRIVVTKFHPVTVVEELHRLGVRDVGENRQQELTAKVAQISHTEGLRWHFIGQAQANKARLVRAAASAVHSVDRARIADALETTDAGAAVLDVLLQINLTDDPERGGVAPEGLETLAEHVAGCRTLRLRGVMAVAPLDEEPAAAFARLNGYSLRTRAIAPEAVWISAGMTNDFVEAIDAGATHLRIGSAITGPRPPRG